VIICEHVRVEGAGGACVRQSYIMWRARAHIWAGGGEGAGARGERRWKEKKSIM